MKNAALLNIVKILSFLAGFLGALFLLRNVSMVFGIPVFWIYIAWFDLGFVSSALWFGACMAVFSFSVWKTKPSRNLPHRNVDYSMLVLFCLVCFYVGYYILVRRFDFSTMVLWPIWLPEPMITVPVGTYTIAMLTLGEFWARLRDKTLVPTLYWVAFFKVYPVWRLVGFLALVLLTSQLVLLVYYSTTSVRVLSLFVICALTYFAAHITNLSKEYSKANAEKLRAERFKSELITNVSHDIKTPLTSIINNVDLLKSEGLQGQAANYINVLDKKSARLKVLIEDLMEASKAGTGNMRVDMREINLGEMLGQVAGEFEGNFTDRNLTLVIRQPDEPVIINSDSRHLYRTLENLFSNVSKYALSGTRVFAEIILQGGKQRIVIQNTSENPITLSDGEATEQFIRGDKSRQTNGSGLGLYIAKSLAELIGGTLTITISGDLFRVDVGF